MMNKIILICTAILLLAGCSKPQAGLQSSEVTAPSKVINPQVDALDGGVIVRLISSEAAQAMSVYGEVSPVFPSTPGKEGVEKKYGLDKWFSIRCEGTDPRELASRLEEDESVEIIEFSTAQQRPYDVSEMSVQDLMTRAAVPSEPVTMNDPLFKSQWFLHNNGSKDMFGSKNVAGTDVSIRDAWRLEGGDPSVIVAVVDEGIKYNHPDLAAAMWVNTDEIPDNGIDDDKNGYVDDIHGYNFLENGPVSWNKSGDSGHATHVAGLVGAVNNNGIGISSVAGGTGNGDGVRLMSCQIFSGSTPDNVSAYAAAIKYAADNGASVLQCSFGESSGRYTSDKAFEEGMSVVKDALDYFRDPANAKCKAVSRNIIVFSAGNEYEPMACYPGAYRDYICVSAISQDNLPAWYTNYGKGVNIAAPGGDNAVGITMLSTVPNETDPAKGDYAFMHGTSMATPVVSGIVALGLSYALKLGRTYDADDFKSMVLTSVNSIESQLTGTKTTPSGTLMRLDSYKGMMGTGVIDAWKLLMNVEGVPFTTVKTGSEAVIDLSKWFGEDARHLTWTGSEAEKDDQKALGLSKCEIDSEGRLHVTCDNVGCGKIKVHAIAGGSVEGSQNAPGGMKISRTISLVSRHNVSTSGGWL